MKVSYDDFRYQVVPTEGSREIHVQTSFNHTFVPDHGHDQVPCAGIPLQPCSSLFYEVFLFEQFKELSSRYNLKVVDFDFSGPRFRSQT